MTDTTLLTEKRVETASDFVMEVYIDSRNSRLRIDDFRGNVFSIIERIEEMMVRYTFSKVFVKAKSENWRLFLSEGYILEGVFKGYFDGSDAYSMACYFDLNRRTSDFWIKEDQILQQVQALPINPQIKNLPRGYLLQPGSTQHAKQLARLYNTVFKTYPTLLNDERYIREVMEAGALFYIIERDGEIVSAASAEINGKYHNAEITDCATLEEHRQYGLMKIVIRALEKELHQRKIFYSYSLSRALSFGMNAVFYQFGYEYTGRLIKNCNIYDKYEDMNLWSKDLSCVLDLSQYLGHKNVKSSN